MRNVAIIQNYHLLLNCFTYYDPLHIFLLITSFPIFPLRKCNVLKKLIDSYLCLKNSTCNKQTEHKLSEPCHTFVSSYSSDTFFSELCWGKAMMAYTKPQQRKEEESKRLRDEGEDKIKFIDFIFEREQVVGFWKRIRQGHYINCTF